MSSSATLTHLIASAGAELTPTDRRIAEAVLAEPTLLAFGTVSDLADRVGTSRPSVVRFAHRLGFHGYSELQEQMRSEVSRRLVRPSERIRDHEQTDSATHQDINDALGSVYDALRDPQVNHLVEPIVNARRVWVLSGETSRAGAIAFTSGLSMIRPDVHLLDDRSIGNDLSNAGPGDTAVVFDFYRYRRFVVNTTRLLGGSGVKIVAVTDSPLSPLVELADAWCQIAVPAVGPFDSSVPVVAIAELLVSKIARELKDKATERIDRIESLWESTETFFQ